MAFREIKIINAPSQRFVINVADNAMLFHFKYNTRTDRWTFDLSVNNVDVISGRKVVLNIDLLAPYGFGVGLIVAIEPENQGQLPDRNNLVNGTIRLFHDI